MSKHVARWRSVNPDRALLICLCCGETIDEDIIGGNPSGFIQIGECNATAERRAAALDEVLSIMTYRSAYPVGIYPPPGATG
jgi:hypothetical protein